MAVNIGNNYKADSATESTVSSSASSVTILAANQARTLVTIWNDSTQILNLSFSATATATKGIKLAPDAILFLEGKDYTGVISGIWASANGSAEITETT